MTKKVVVIGAGPAGLACAARLARERVEVTVLEASSDVGGMARTIPLWDQRVDLGPHRFFSANQRVNRFWREFVGDDFTTIDRLTRIYFNGRFFQYPLRPFDVLARLGPLSGARAISSYAVEQLRRAGEPATYQDFLIQRFGNYLFDSFFRNYSEKLWGIPCDRIDPSWGSQRIGKLSVLETLKAALKPGAGRTHKTLLDQFHYPKGGSGVVYERMAEEIRHHGGKVHVGSRVRSILASQGNVRGVRLQDGSELHADRVVSTLPLTQLALGLPDVPDPVRSSALRLRFRNTILVYLEVSSKSVFPDNWIYVNSGKVLHGRITNFRNWCTSLHQGRPTTILCMEFWSFDEDNLWKMGDEPLGRLAETELERIGLLPNGARALRYHVFRVPKSYPVYEVGFQKLLRPIQDFVNAQKGLLAIGRGGSFKYNNQDHSILMGLVASDEIMTGTPQGLWDLNSDSEYQEHAPLGDEGVADAISA